MGFRFNNSLFEESENLTLDIILTKENTDKILEFGYVRRTIKKKELLVKIKKITIQVANEVHFENDSIDWKFLEKIKE